MRIAQIAPPWITIPPKNYGGTENVLYDLIEELRALGHDVTLYATGDAKTSARLVSFLPRALSEDGVPWREHLQPYYHLHKAVEHCKLHQYDIVHAHLSVTQDLFLFPLLSTLRTPHVATLHSNFPFDKMPGNWVGDADRYYMDWASDVPLIAISKSAQAQQSLPVKFVGVVHNGISLRKYQPTGKPRSNFFMWMGRLVPEKGAHNAIQVARRAGIPLLLAGSMDRSTKEMQRYFQQEVRASCDGTQIRYIGPVNAQQKINLLSQARGLLNPIEWEEPFGMVMIEAMALGCPVITFARGAAPEIVVHGQTGLLVQNVDEMVEAIAHIDELDRDAIRKHVAQHFSARIMAEHYLEVYQKVIAENLRITMR
jgi:glycosyltransferase involved in cell wall biosynthesis